MHKLSSYIASIHAEIISRIVTHKNHSKVPIPYVCQFASPSLVYQFLTGTLSPLQDPVWKKSGAKTKQEYTVWVFNMCGMACTAMILDYLKIEHPPLVVMGKRCAEYGGYQIKKDVIDGLFYHPFCKYLYNEFRLHASVAPFLTISRIISELAIKKYIIVSVSPYIRDKDNKKPKISGGHLVVITGYDKRNKTIIINNPSGIFKKSQKDYVMTFVEFKKFFAGRGIIIHA